MGWDVDGPGVGGGAEVGAAIFAALRRDHVAARKPLILADYHTVGKGLDFHGVGWGTAGAAGRGRGVGATRSGTDLARNRIPGRDKRTRGHADGLGRCLHLRRKERDNSAATDQDEEQKHGCNLTHDVLLSYVCKDFHFIRVNMNCLISIICVWDKLTLDALEPKRIV